VAERISAQSHAFCLDADRFDSTRLAYRSISDRFIGTLVGIFQEPSRRGRSNPLHTRLLAHAYRQWAVLIRDEEVLGRCGITAGQEMLELERVFCTGICVPQLAGAQAANASAA
jgi:hypothetical protein